MELQRAGSPIILVFDSGVGGLSVLDEIVAKRPECLLIYASDSGFLPYGLKSDAQLKARVPALLSALEAGCNPDLIVIACNTASTIALEEARAAVTCPVVGVVPAIKPAAARSASRVIGFLGTPGTVERQYSDGLIRQFAGGCAVIRCGAPALVELAEAKLAGAPPAPEAIEAALAPMFARPRADEMDVAVLACTHFPLLRAEIEAASPPGLIWIDSGEAVARRALDVLGLTPDGGEARPIAVFSSDTGAMAGAAPAFTARGFPDFPDWRAI